MLRNALIRLFINATALVTVDFLFSGIQFRDNGSLILAAIVFGLLNTFIKPILLIFTLPINILTLGLFTIIINGIILQLTDFLLDSFYISSFGLSILAAILISLVSIIMQGILQDKKIERY